jgi:hypothetical protein
MASIKFGLLILFTICISIEYTNAKDIKLRYKSNATFDCSSLDGDVEFYSKYNGTEKKIESEGKFKIDGKTLTVNDLRGENLKAEYTCKSASGKIEFVNQLEPYIFKPEKQSQTATEGGTAEFKCKLLFGNEQGDANLNWEWKRVGNFTALEEGDRIVIEGRKSNETTLRISKVTEEDKGAYVCVINNAFGEHSEEIKLRVKDAYAALWPFLAIVAEVFILCTIILIYEKKCAKKSTDDDNDQAQNLMGNKDGQPSDVKKRNPKA